jgi:hypothetical protein
VNAASLATLIGSVGAFAGAGGAAFASKLLFRRQHQRLLEAQAADVRSTADSRIIDAAADLVTQSGGITREYGERIARTEERLVHQATENDRLRSEVGELRAVVTIVSADNAELRAWAGQISSWAQRAVGEIERLNGHIDPPPPAPAPRQPAPFPADRWTAPIPMPVPTQTSTQQANHTTAEPATDTP